MNRFYRPIPRLAFNLNFSVESSYKFSDILPYIIYGIYLKCDLFVTFWESYF